MSQSKFKVGDIIEHEDGSLYVVGEIREYSYVCGTILEKDALTRKDNMNGIPYTCALEVAPRVWTKIGHIDEAV